MLSKVVSSTWPEIEPRSPRSLSLYPQGQQAGYIFMKSAGAVKKKLQLCRGVIPPLTSVLNLTLNNLMVRFLQCWSFGKCRAAFITITSRSTLAQSVVPDRVLSMGQIELNFILTLNWIAWDRTVLIFKLCTYAKLKCLK